MLLRLIVCSSVFYYWSVMLMVIDGYSPVRLTGSAGNRARGGVSNKYRRSQDVYRPQRHRFYYYNPRRQISQLSPNPSSLLFEKRQVTPNLDTTESVAIAAKAEKAYVICTTYDIESRVPSYKYLTDRSGNKVKTGKGHWGFSNVCTGNSLYDMYWFHPATTNDEMKDIDHARSIVDELTEACNNRFPQQQEDGKAEWMAQPCRKSCRQYDAFRIKSATPASKYAPAVLDLMNMDDALLSVRYTYLTEFGIAKPQGSLNCV